jgi:hypothetical protein
MTPARLHNTSSQRNNTPTIPTPLHDHSVHFPPLAHMQATLALVVLVALASCCSALTPVPALNVTAYLGRWYQVRRRMV